MGNILYIQATSFGCEIAYTNKEHHVIKVNKDEKLKKWLMKLGDNYNQPIKETMHMMKSKYGYHQKVPIFIKGNEILLFSPVSLKSDDCCLVNFYCVEKFKKDGSDTNLFFQDHSILCTQSLEYKKKLSCDPRVIRKQMERCKRIHDDYQNVLPIEEFVKRN